MSKYAIEFALAILACLLLTPWVDWLARRVGAIDTPGGRHLHQRPTPRLGGLSIYGSILLSFAVMWVLDRLAMNTLYGSGAAVGSVMVSAAIVLAIGLVDDIFSVNPSIKVVTVVAAALVAVPFGYNIDRVFNVQVGYWGIPLTVAWILAVTNAINLVDGLDGLASGVSLIISATLLTVAIYYQRIPSAMILAALCGALAGFLRFNFYPARIFLGDSGSLLIGFLFGVISIRISAKLSALVAILIPMLALGLPLAEVALTILRRFLSTIHVMRREPERGHYEFFFFGRAALFSADSSHIHHRLLALGLNQRSAVLLLYGITAALCAGAFVLVFARGVNQALLLAAFGTAALIGIGRLRYREFQFLRSGLLLPFLESPIISQRAFQVLFDLAASWACYMASYLIWRRFNLSIELKDWVLRSAPLVCFAQVGCFLLSGMYKCSYRYASIREVLTMMRALILASAATWLALYVMSGWQWPPPTIPILDGYLLATAISGSRLSFRVLDYLFKRGQERGRRVVIYGTGRTAALALQDIQSSPSLGLRVVGLVSVGAGAVASFHGLPTLSQAKLDEMIRNVNFEELIIADPDLPADQIEAVARRCVFSGVRVRRFSVDLSSVAVPQDPMNVQQASRSS